MSTLETLERFIARVEQNAHAEAIEEFYTENSSMRENLSEPRVGRDLHVANERKVLARARSVESRCVRPVFVNGDHVMGNQEWETKRVRPAELHKAWTETPARDAESAPAF